MVLSDPAKSGLEIGAWIDGSDYQSKGKKNTITKYKNLFFLEQRIIAAKTMRFPAILDVILNNIQR